MGLPLPASEKKERHAAAERYGQRKRLIVTASKTQRQKCAAVDVNAVAVALIVGKGFNEKQSAGDIAHRIVRTTLRNGVCNAYFAFDAQLQPGVPGMSDDMPCYRIETYKKRYPVASQQKLDKHRAELEAGTMVLAKGRLYTAAKAPLNDDFPFDCNTSLTPNEWSRVVGNSLLKRKLYRILALEIIRLLCEREGPLEAVVDPPTDRTAPAQECPVHIKIIGDTVSRTPCQRTNAFGEADLRVQHWVTTHASALNTWTVHTCDYDMLAQLIATCHDPNLEVSLSLTKGGDTIRISDYAGHFCDCEPARLWHIFLLLECGSDYTPPLRGFGIRPKTEGRDNFVVRTTTGPLWVEDGCLCVNPQRLIKCLAELWHSRSYRKKNTAQDLHDCLVRCIWIIMYWLMANPNPDEGQRPGPDPALSGIQLFSTHGSHSAKEILLGNISSSHTIRLPIR